MPRCVNCRNLERSSRDCSYLHATIVLKHIHQSIPCDGYKPNEVNA